MFNDSLGISKDERKGENEGALHLSIRAIAAVRVWPSYADYGP